MCAPMGTRTGDAISPRQPSPAVAGRGRSATVAVRAVVAAVAVVLVAVVVPPLAGASPAAAASPAVSTPAVTGSVIAVSGKGFGHGRGMGQWGAYGYAVVAGWSWPQILDHYYGGTALGALPADRQRITVELSRMNAAGWVAAAGSRLVIEGLAGEYGALRATLNPDGTWRIEQAADCAGPWTPVAGAEGFPAPLGIRFDRVGGVDEGAPVDALTRLCEADGRGTPYRGRLFGFATDRGTRVVNEVGMEAYLRGVVPRESPASWGTAGGGTGMHALRAQAVAARSYAATQARYPWALTCDTTNCQVYGGAAGEAATTDQAVADTAGLVRVRASGAVASTEYSSSTGGWTAGGSFPAVRDEGDDLAAGVNATAAGHHDWKTTITVAAVEAAFPEVGTLVSIDVTRRNGLGDYGGRVLEVVVRGTAGERTLSGWDFRGAFGLKSDWFAVSEDATCGSGGPPPPLGPLPAAEPTTFHPLVPTRILDTRDGTGALATRLGSGCTLAVTVTGRGGVPADGVRAVTLNLTAAEAAGDGYLTAYPCGAPLPSTSSVNYAAGVPVANLVTVPVGAGGQVCIFAYRTVHVVIDVAGWSSADATGARFTGVTPDRLVDTRDGTGLGGTRSPVAPGGVVPVAVAGRSGVPAGGEAGAVVLNLTVTESAGDGYLSAYPCDQPAYASALNHVAGATVANQVVVPLDAGGNVCVLSYAGGHVVADALGWYGPPGAPSGQRFTPLTPARIHDTRVGLPPGATRMAAGTAAPVAVLGQGGVPGGGVGAVSFNLTAADPGGPGYLSAYPCGGAPPNASNVNHDTARAAANLVTVPLGTDEQVCVFSYADTDVVVDIAGWFGP